MVKGVKRSAAQTYNNMHKPEATHTTHPHLKHPNNFLPGPVFSSPSSALSILLSLPFVLDTPSELASTPQRCLCLPEQGRQLRVGSRPRML